MRVKDPLQGIKCLKGHTVMHICFYVASLRVDLAEYTEKGKVPPGQFDKDALAAEYDVFLFMQQGHLASAILQLLAFSFKSCGSHYMQKVLNFFLNITYLLP